jgi:hypothetical protein
MPASDPSNVAEPHAFTLVDVVPSAERRGRSNGRRGDEPLTRREGKGRAPQARRAPVSPALLVGTTPRRTATFITRPPAA